jgi:hypothetical protein
MQIVNREEKMGVCGPQLSKWIPKLFQTCSRIREISQTGACYLFRCAALILCVCSPQDGFGLFLFFFYLLKKNT